MAKGGSRRGARRVHPLTVILIGAFVAAVVFAGYTITKRILDVRAANHAKALASCVSAQSDFAKTYTSYASTVGAAGKLARTDPAYVANPEYLDDLKSAIAPMTSGSDGTDMDELASGSCAEDMAVADLDDRADALGRADSQMTNRMITVQYQADIVKQSIEGKRNSDSRSQIAALLPDATLAMSRSAGKADERLRAALQSAVDAANQAMNGGTDVGNDRYLDILVSLQSSYDAVVGALPNDCHFHACVALTFDDGPNKQLTPKLLDALAAAGVQATFFVQGQYVSGSNVKLVQREVAEGHAVGSMSWRHTQLHDMPADQLKKWFDDTDAVISAATGQPVTLFRPPDGAWSDAVREQAKASGQTMILWNVDSRDWERGAGAPGIRDNVVGAATRGSIISLHDGNEDTIEAIPGIVQGLRDKGLTPVTIPHLLDGDLTPGAMYYYLGDPA
ncbi:MAG: polysaccharide deacetylase family protein [Bifidobacterium scardovii]|uniref:polysaccharide deacetylase family protein n=1 Tax=Bifidobacterium scardovii TaxID=158787 RepID=UPI000667FC39|nr:polysaccharide deacetylase family protein [Bifidobacterium scardovii]MBS6947237.1 polysaccharide deacetylase family protein [Bifidobacterium scardovii]MDU3737098.1 polysaccharide deacetylase family protein [Bifidobacterium scardovii]MDU5297718.1 polysaccharide deacetylase family protein [Bifidobacterium scardovii]MDU5887092.1 polysaccharide deacetylase family protein [Bifidobacterium scardovii]MDU6282964.1 polysaccharide deacetylase family protein [Bifidobacterium scardovii]